GRRAQRALASGRASGLDGASLDEAAVAALADELPIADDGATADEHRSNGALHLEAFVRCVVAGVMEVGGAEGSAGRGIEEHQVRIATDLDRALPGEPEEAGRRRGDEVHEPLDREP